MKNLPFMLLWLLVFAIPWEAAIPLPLVGTGSRALGYAALCAVALAVFSGASLRKLGLVHAAQATFIAWCAATAFWTADLDLTRERLFTYVRVMGFAWLIWQSAWRRADQRRLLTAYVLGATVPMVVIFLGAAYEPASFGLVVRRSAVGMNPNNLASIFAMSIVFAAYLATSDRTTSRTTRSLLLAYCPLAAMAAVQTGSRGGLVQLIIATTAILLWRPSRFWPRVAILAGALVVVMASSWLVPTGTLDRLLSTRSMMAAGDLSGRGDILRDGLELFRERPLLGVGCGTFIETAGAWTGRTSHNTYLAILVEDGIIGLALFLLIVGLALANARGLGGPDRALWLTALLLWVVSGMVSSGDYTKTTWLVLGAVTARRSDENAAALTRSGPEGTPATRRYPWQRTRPR